MAGAGRAYTIRQHRAPPGVADARAAAGGAAELARKAGRCNLAGHLARRRSRDLAPISADLAARLAPISADLAPISGELGRISPPRGHDLAGARRHLAQF